MSDNIRDGMKFAMNANRHPEGTSQIAFEQIIDEKNRTIADLLAALEGVVRVADRKTVEFDAARAAIAKAKGQ